MGLKVLLTGIFFSILIVYPDQCPPSSFSHFIAREKIPGY
jgi:hypothetical protein